MYEFNSSDQFNLLYSTLRKIASRERSRNPSLTLSTTVVVHEAWMKLRQAQRGDEWHDQDHYLATAALAMRQLLVDYARKKASSKRTQTDNCPLFENSCNISRTIQDVITVDNILDELESLEPRLARLVELRFFVGLTLAEAAQCLSISASTADRDWKKARAFISVALKQE